MNKLISKLGIPVAMLASMAFGASMMGVANAHFLGEKSWIAARVSLHDALTRLTEAPVDGLGHRQAALNAVNTALGETDAAIHTLETRTR